MVLDICQVRAKCLLNNVYRALLVQNRNCVKKIIFYSEIKFIIEVMRFRWRRKREKLLGWHFILLSNYRIAVLNWCLFMHLWRCIS